MTSESASHNYIGGLLMTAAYIRLNTVMERLPAAWVGRLRERVGPRVTWDDLGRWQHAVGQLADCIHGGINPDASDAEICQQADLTVRDMVARLRDVRAVWLGVDRARLAALGPAFTEAMEALAVRQVMDERGLSDLWPAPGSSNPDCPLVGRWQRSRRAWLRRIVCSRFWRRVYRRLHARTVESLAIRLGLVRSNAGLYCSDDTAARSRAQDRRNKAVLESVHAINDLQQAYTLAELSARGVANQAIRRQELLTRIAGFELIAKDCKDIAFMVTVTCPSRCHAATTRTDGRVVDNPRSDHSTPAASQAYLARQWRCCCAAARRLGLTWYGFRIAEPQHDGTPHWHLLLFMPRQADGMDSAVLLRALFRRYFLDNESPEERGAAEHRVQFEEIDWGRPGGSAVGYVIKYISKGIDGHCVGVDLYGQDAITSSERVRAWARTWRIRQFQQVGGAPVGLWRELRRINPDNVPATAPKALRASMSAMNVAKVEPGVQALAWAKFTQAAGGVCVSRKHLRIKLIKQRTGELGRYGEVMPARVIGVCAAGIELFRNHIHVMNPVTAPYQRRITMGIESERSEWITGSNLDVLRAVAQARFQRSGEAASTRIHVNNCTRPDPSQVSEFAPRTIFRRKLRRFATWPTKKAPPEVPQPQADLSRSQKGGLHATSNPRDTADPSAAKQRVHGAPVRVQVHRFSADADPDGGPIGRATARI